MDEAEASDGFSDWEQIQAPTYSTPPLTTSGEHDNHPQHQHDLSVFPPIRHEGLRITSDDDDDDEEEEEEEEEEEVHVHDESEVNSSVGSWSSTGDEANSRPLKKTNEIGKILTNWIVKVGARVRCHMAFGWGFWPVGAVTGAVAAVLLSLVYAKVSKWRARIKEDKKDRLIFLIQEKDQKINQLLVQIAQINELLSARRRVPVFRVS